MCRKWIDAVPPFLKQRLPGWEVEHFYHTWEGLWALCEEVRDEWAMGVELHPVRGTLPAEDKKGEGADKVVKKSRSKSRTNKIGPIIRWDLKNNENRILPLPGAPWESSNKGPSVSRRVFPPDEYDDENRGSNNAAELDPQEAFLREQMRSASQEPQKSELERAQKKEQQRRKEAVDAKRETATMKIQATIRGRKARQQVSERLVSVTKTSEISNTSLPLRVPSAFQ